MVISCKFMCGIFGYVGKKNASQVILEGLKRLEYRGYDSWGIAVAAEEILVNKKVGAIGDLNRLSGLPEARVGIGHTRWATHGGITQNNAHPHFSSDEGFILAQNGIVENYQSLKEMLEKKGYNFTTQTDTEVIVRLIESKLKLLKNLKESIRTAFLELKGRNTIIVLTKDSQIIAVRNGSPLVVGISPDSQEYFFSSDTLSFAPFARKIVVIDNGQMIFYQSGRLDLYDVSKNSKLPYRFENISIKNSKVDKEGYDHFMIKEIHDTPYVINQLISQRIDDYSKFAKDLKQANNVYTIGSGTAGIAAAQIAFYLRVFAKISATNLIGADAHEYYDLITKDDLIIAPSQSGETADVLEVLEILRNKGVKIASYVNMLGSTMTRLSDYSFLTQAGPEICVMSTKVFTSQISWGYLVSKIASGKGEEALEDLTILAQTIEKFLNTESNHQNIKEIAKKLSRKKDIFLLGKYQNFNIVKEGMVKIIEGSYIHAHGIPSGDLKHYAITLMDKGVPVIVAVSNDQAKFDVMNAVSQVRTRGAEVVGISAAENDNFDFFIKVPDTGETSAIMNIIPLQLLAYYMAVELGHNVDKPRNIAKSVTVK